MGSGIVFLPSYHEAIKGLPDADRLQMYDAIVRYGLYGEVIELSPMTKSLFTLIKPNIDSSQNRYRAAKANGSKGGRPVKNQTENQSKNQTENQKQNQDMDMDKDKEKDRDSDIDRERENTPAPAPPTVEDVQEYCIQQCLSDFPAQRFVDYYQIRNWKIDGEPVSDWKALVRVWIDRDKEKQQPKRITTFMDVPDADNRASQVLSEMREQRRKELGLDW